MPKKTKQSSSIRIQNELAMPIQSLPEKWQQIALGTNSKTRLSEPDMYVKMAQLFLSKFALPDVDLFNRTVEYYDYKESFKGLFQQLAYDTLSFFAEDFQIEKYPNLMDLTLELDKNDPEYPDKIKVVKISRDLFEEFGHDLPASFYHVHLAPIHRSQVCEVVPLRFSEQDKKNARAWDACLHGQKVFPIQMRIQSISSKYGFVWEHGCGCNHGLSRIGKTNQSFEYQLNSKMRRTWIRDYVWTIWYEYAFFLFTPVTKLLTGEIVQFEN